MKAVVVRFYGRKPPQEIGRAVLQPDGTALIYGFDTPGDAEMRRHWETVGIRDYRVHGRVVLVKPTDGAHFLDALAYNFVGGITRAAIEDV
jgi:hypothetical protein